MRAAIGAVMLLLITELAWCSVHRVPSDHPTIQEAIDAAADGDTVLVAPGTYTGDGNRGLELGSKNLCVVSESGPENTIIDCESADRGFFFSGAQTLDTTVRGFTIRNGREDFGAGMRFGPNAAACVRDCVFENGHAYAWGFNGHGGGISCGGDTYPIIEDCLFIGNVSTNLGGGLAIAQGSPKVSRCEFVDNCSRLRGGGLYAESCTPVVKDCVFTENHASSSGGGMCLWRCASPRVTRCQFIHNWSLGEYYGWGGGLYSRGYNAPHISFCTFDSNSANEGGGIAVHGGCFPDIFNCTFVGNSSNMGAGIRVGEDCNVLLEDSIIAFSELGRAVWCYQNSLISVYHTVIYGNQQGDWTGCLLDELWWHHNRREDPLFCYGENPDEPYTVYSHSYCAPANNPPGVQIGAWGVGCIATRVEEASWGRVKSLFRQ